MNWHHIGIIRANTEAMMNQTEATSCLLQHLPELDRSIQSPCSSASFYPATQAFLQLTCHQVTAHNYRMARRCFQLADRLYVQGNATVKRAIENLFVFAMDRIFSQAGRDQHSIRGLVPISLYTAYINQVMKHGC